MNDKAELFVDSRCELGEGPFWHRLLGRLFWFDILNKTLFSADTSGRLVDRFTFKDTVSAAGVIDEDHLLVAQAGALLRFELSSQASTVVTTLDEGRPGNRTNDGRVDPAGGLWIGTMSRRGGAEPGVGTIYQYREGVLTQLIEKANIPNSICFSPDGRRAYYTHTGDVIWTAPIDPATGLPTGEWTQFVKLDGPGVADGSVVDSEGYLWNARWNGSCVLRIAPDGTIDRKIDLPVSRVSCPAFGGDDLRTLYLTTAREGMTPEELEREPHAGSVFAVRVDVPGQLEHLVRP
ncbi:MAG TPA: SMP-30/gluconolactonase/LRE family protein [Alphaproteobacteria bacterium]|nr:SMP-30/gluconolactonase/LRE family protein [Alphaproteobacteria bacterium]